MARSATPARRRFALTRFDDGSADEFWYREGRDAHRLFIGEVCRRAVRRGLAADDPNTRAVVGRIARRVVAEMVRGGGIRGRRG